MNQRLTKIEGYLTKNQNQFKLGIQKNESQNHLP
jgi:hypothetical protein